MDYLGSSYRLILNNRYSLRVVFPHFNKNQNSHITIHMKTHDAENPQDPWWGKNGRFFGGFYMQGDNSAQGYQTSKRQTLEQRTAEEVDGIIRLCKPAPKARIFDLPCGYGRHSNALANLGFRVTGLDINPVHLAKARNDAASGLATFVEHNMLDPLPRGSADVLVNMFFSFGFFDTDEQNELVLQNIYNALAPGGTFLMHTDVNVPMVIKGAYRFNESRALPDGMTLFINERFDEASQRIMGSWTLGDETHGYSVRVYTADEFIGLCKRVGFKDAIAYADWDGSPYSEDSEIMIVTANK